MLSSLINKYTFVKNEIDDSISPKRKLFLVIDFFKECENQGVFPPHKTFIYEFIPHLLDLFQKDNINFIDPNYLISIKILFKLSLKAYEDTEGYSLIRSQIDTTISYLDLKLIKLYFYLGETEEGLSIISKILKTKDENTNTNSKYKTKPGTSIINEFKKNPFSLIDPTIYKDNRAFEIMTEISKENKKIFALTESTLNVMLVEGYYKDNDNMEYYGSIQNLICRINKKKLSKTNEINVTSYQKDNDNDIKETLNNICYSSLEILNKLGYSGNFSNCQINIKFENDNYFYIGNSFSLGAVVLIICSYLKYKVNYKKYFISGVSAFTGAVDSKGNVLPVSEESINTKIEAAFFSWLKYSVIPYENYPNAKKTYEELKKKYPHKEFELIPVKRIDEIFQNPKLIRNENQKINEFAKNKIKKHIIPSSIISAILFIALSLFIIYKIVPKYIKPLPKTENDMYLVYTPDRDTNWIFHNNNFFGGDTIDFGDVAIGDQWFPIIEFWNNSQTKENFNIYLDGENKEDFQITYLKKNEQPEPENFIVNDISQLIYIKFVPTNNTGLKNGRIIFENKGTKKQKVIFLKGQSKRLSNGYCLKLNNCRQLMVLEPGENIIKNNISLTFWIKPQIIVENIDQSSLLSVSNNTLTNNKLALMLNTDTTLNLIIYGSKSREIQNIYITTKNKLKLQDWNFVGISIKDTTLSIILNDDYFSSTIQKNALRVMNDCICFGSVSHPSERETNNNLTTYYEILLDEFKVINLPVSPEELIANRFEQDKYSKYCTAEYSFDDATPKRIFDNSIYDFWPNIFGGITRDIDSTQPFSKSKIKEKNMNGENSVFKRTNKGFLKLNKNLFTSFSSFTLQCDFKIDKNKIPNQQNSEPSPFFINRSGLDIRYGTENDSVRFVVWDTYKGNYHRETIVDDFSTAWNRYTISYNIDSNTLNFYLNNKLLKQFNNTEILNITDNYMGISFAIYNYFASPRFSLIESEIDNIKIFNRSLRLEEIYTDDRNGLIAYWTFEKTDKELAFDEINNLPLLMWGEFEIINENIIQKK